MPRPRAIVVRLAVVAAALTLALLGPPATRAATAAPAHRCACGMDCRGRCCCAPREPRVRRESPAPVPSRRLAGPCVAPAPCREPGRPATSAPVPVVKMAALVATVRARPDRPSGRADRLVADLHPVAPDDPPDDPPERPDERA